MLEDTLLGDKGSYIPFFWNPTGGALSSGIFRELARLFQSSNTEKLFIANSQSDAELLMQSPDLSRMIHPYELWNGQRGWFATVDTESGKEPDVSVDSRRLLFPVTLIIGTSVPEKGRKPDDDGLHLYLDPGHPSAPATDHLAQVLALYLFSAWSEFCRTRSGEIHGAFSLNGSGNRFAIGASWVGPDWEPVTVDTLPSLYSEMLERWKAAGDPPDDSISPTLKEIVQLAVPDRGFVISDKEEEPPQAKIENPDDARWISMVDDFKLGKFSDWGKRIGNLEELARHIHVFVIGNVKSIASSRIIRRFEQFEKNIEPYLNPFRKKTGTAMGILNDMQGRIELLQDDLANLLSMDASDPLARPGLRSRIAKIKQSVLSIPDLKSAFLRLFIIGVGCVWLFLGAFVWQEGWDFTQLDSDVRLYTGLGIGVAFLAIVAVLMGRWLYFTRSSLRFEDLARQDICAKAAMALAEQVVWTTDKEAERGRALVTVYDQSVNTLINQLEEGIEVDSRRTAQIPDPRFPVEKLVPFFQTRFQQIADEANRIFFEHMAAVPFTLEATIWKTQADGAIREAMDATVSTFTFEDICRDCNLSSSDKERLVGEAIRNARRILIDREVHGHPPALLFLSRDWEAHGGDYDLTVFREVPVPSNALCAICAVSLDELGGRK